MTTFTADTSQRKAARIARLLFLFTFIFPTITWVFVSSKFIVAGNVIAAANIIIANELLFRIGIITELIRSALTSRSLRIQKNISMLVILYWITDVGQEQKPVNLLVT